MADYRQIHTCIWKDSWFLELEPAYKLIFIYLFSNDRVEWPGTFKLDPKKAFEETGLSLQIIYAAIYHFAEAGKVVADEDSITITNFTKYQQQRTPYSPGFVYVIYSSASALFKIGISKNVKNRMAQLRYKHKEPGMSLVFTYETNCMRWIEHRLHERFADKRVRGEWFDLDDADLGWLNDFDPAPWEM